MLAVTWTHLGLEKVSRLSYNDFERGPRPKATDTMVRAVKKGAYLKGLIGELGLGRSEAHTVRESSIAFINHPVLSRLHVYAEASGRRKGSVSSFETFEVRISVQNPSQNTSEK